MITFTVTIYLDVAEMFKKTVSNEAIYQKIRERLLADSPEFWGLREAIVEKYEDKGDEGKKKIAKYDSLSIGAVMNFLSFDRDGAEVDVSEAEGIGDFSGTAILLPCKFDDASALWV